jgi:hypothetical protein
MTASIVPISLKHGMTTESRIGQTAIGFEWRSTTA